MSSTITPPTSSTDDESALSQISENWSGCESSPSRSVPEDFAMLLDQARGAEALGRFCEARGYYEQVVNYCQRMLVRDPINWKLHELKGRCEYRTGAFRKAWLSFQRARADRSLYWPCLLGQIKAGLEIGLWKDLEHLSEGNFAEWVENDWVSASTLLTLPIAKQGDDLRRAAAIEARRRAGDYKGQENARHVICRGGKIRVGFLSADFNNHAVAHQVVRLLECLDRSRFELFAYSVGHHDNSRIGRRVRNCFQAIREGQGSPAPEIAGWIREDCTDILIDLSGHTSGNRMDVLALRPAPIQVSWLGYPGTTGAEYIDYLVVDDIVAPPVHRDHFSEALVKLPHCYLPADNRQPVCQERPTRASCGLAKDAVVFAAFHPAYKLDPAMFKTWMAILQYSPNACLWLRAKHPELRENLATAIKAHGVDLRQVVFDDVILEKSAYLARLQLADVFLDTSHFNGHSTVSDALWAGLPVITTPGDTFAARVGASLVTAAGIPQCIAPTLAGYERMGITLASNSELRESLKSTLCSNRLSAPLFDTESWTHHFEHALTRMIAIHQSAESPRDFSIRV